MATRFTRFAASILLPAALVACGSETPTPTESVRLAVIAGGHTAGAPFATGMDQEVTHLPDFREGDPNGSGEALLTVNHGQRRVCWELRTAGLASDAFAAHIHKAAPDVRGPIVVTLSAPPGQSGVATGCANGLDRELLREILTSPASFYVNVHTTNHPIGAIRGQLGQ